MVLDYHEHRGTHSTEWARCYGEAEPAHSGIDMASEVAEEPDLTLGFHRS